MLRLDEMKKNSQFNWDFGSRKILCIMSKVRFGKVCIGLGRFCLVWLEGRIV
jgi:hypothetical protein